MRGRSTSRRARDHAEPAQPHDCLVESVLAAGRGRWRLAASMTSSAVRFRVEVVEETVPDESSALRLRDAHDRDVELRVYEYSLLIDETIAQMWRQDFGWAVAVLGE